MPRWTAEAWSMARASPEKTTMSRRTVIVTDPLSCPGASGEGGVLEKDGRFMGMSSFGIEFEADADERGRRVEAPISGRHAFEDGLRRAGIRPPAQDARGAVAIIGDKLEEGHAGGPGTVGPLERRVEKDARGVDGPDRPELPGPCLAQHDPPAGRDIACRDERQARVPGPGL